MKNLSRTTHPTHDFGAIFKIAFIVTFIIALTVTSRADIVRTTIELEEFAPIETNINEAIEICKFLDGEYHEADNTCTIELAFDNDTIGVSNE